MKHLIITIVALLTCSALFADDMRLSDSLSCKYLGSLYYGENVGYQLNFETDNLNLYKRQGEGKLLTVTVVVPRKGNKGNALPLGEFTLGSCDSVRVGSVDFYRSSVRYYGVYNDTYDKPDILCSFLQCKVTISSLKKNVYSVNIKYELNNGEKGDLSYVGKVKNERLDSRAKFNFMPNEQRTKNWQLTHAKIELEETTAYSSREATLSFLCADEIYGMVTLYLPLDSINGHYIIRYGKEVYSCEKSTGGYDGQGYFNMFNSGIEEDSSGYIYYLESGYLDIMEGKMFFEFITRDGSTVRGVFKGDIPVKDAPK